jgi:hypothetical protein
MDMGNPLFEDSFFQALKLGFYAAVDEDFSPEDDHTPDEGGVNLLLKEKESPDDPAQLGVQDFSACPSAERE